MFCFVRGYGGQRAWRTMVWPTRWTPFLFRPGWLGAGRLACGLFTCEVAAATALWLVRGCLGRLMVGLVSVGFVALLPVVV